MLPRKAFRAPALMGLASRAENRSCPREEPIGQLGDAKGSYLVGIDRRWGSPGQTGNAVELHHADEPQGARGLLPSFHGSPLKYSSRRLSEGPYVRLQIDTNFSDIARWIGDLEKQVKFSAAVALTRTAKDVQKEIPAELDRHFDKPTDFTKRGTFVTPAKRDNLEAVVGFKDRQARYMAIQIAGGTYSPGGAGIKLPGNIQLDTFGNIPRGMINRLKAAAQSGSLSGALSKKLGTKAGKKAPAVRLFFGQPRGSGWEGAPLGIYRHIPSATPGGSGKLVPVIVFEKKSAVYGRRFDFEGMVNRIAQDRFPGHFNDAFSKAMRTAKP